MPEITFDMFYDISIYGNTNWKGGFSSKEVAHNAYEYKCEYESSVKNGKPTETMKTLCRLLVEDMDKADYEEENNKLDIVTMNELILDFYESIW